MPLPPPKKPVRAGGPSPAGVKPSPRPPASGEASPGWSNRIVSLPTDNGLLTKPAEVLGPFAVHPCTFEDPPTMWTVTCLPVRNPDLGGRTGIALAHFREKRDARRAAEYLLARCRRAFVLPDKAQVLAALPKWVRPWCLAMNKERAWVDPSPFKEEASS